MANAQIGKSKITVIARTPKLASAFDDRTPEPVVLIGQKIGASGQNFARFKFSDGNVILVSTSDMAARHNAGDLKVFKEAQVSENSDAEWIDDLQLGVKDGEVYA